MLIFLICLCAHVWAKELDSPQGKNQRRDIPEGFLYGLALNTSQELYIGADNKYLVFPVLGYRKDKLFIFGPFVSYQAAQIGKTKLSLKARPRFDGYDESDSAIFKGMADRKAGIDAGLELQVEENKWKLSFAGFHDVLGRSNGSEFSFGLGRSMRYGPIFIAPEVKFDLQDRKLVGYYYGVKQSEATEFRPQYDPKSALNSSIGITLSTPIFFQGLTRLSFKHARYDSSIVRSPLIDTESSTSFIMSFSKFIK